MFGSTIIDVVIGLSFIYILLSLVCASLGELISGTFLNHRAKDLEKGIVGLLGDSALVDQFYEHPLIRSLSVNRQRPDYIPSHTFALVLLEVVLRDHIAHDDIYSTRRLINELSAEGNVPESLRKTLLGLCTESVDGLPDLREEVARWYDDCMDRVSGAYKRRLQSFILIAATAITVGVNADSIGMARGIWNAPFLRVTLAEQERVSSLSEVTTAYSRSAIPVSTPTPGYEPRPTPTFSGNVNANVNANTNVNVNAAPAYTGQNSNSAAPVNTTTPMPSPSPFYFLDTPASARQRLTRLAETTGFPLGWSSDDIANDPRGVPADLVGWLLKIGGWLLTVLVVVFGAPMWFDFLNKFMVIRSTIKPREKSRPQPSKDKTDHDLT